MSPTKISKFNHSHFIIASVFFCLSQLELKAQVSPSFGTTNHPIPDDLFGFNDANTIKAGESWFERLNNTTAST